MQEKLLEVIKNFSIGLWTELLTVSRVVMEHLPKEDKGTIWRNIVCQLVKKKTEDENDSEDETGALKNIAEYLSEKLRIQQ